jgi:hypothetical protein
MMDPNVTTLERAFELARSGACTKTDDLRKRLTAEGYDANQLSSWTLVKQLRSAMKNAANGTHPVGTSRR